MLMIKQQYKTPTVFRNMAMKKCLAPLMFVLLMAGAVSASAQEKSADQWQYDFEAYFWMPQMDITTASGTDITLTFKDLLQNLDMAGMFDFGAQKGKWSMNADFIYMNLGAKEEISGEIIGHPVTLDVDIDLRSFISTVHGGYQVAVNDKNQLDVIAGIRYLYIRIPLEFDLNENRTRKVTLGGSDEDKWDGIVGLQGVRTINDKWYFDYYGDIGAGESDLTFQTKLGFGYHFNKFTGTFGFRYLRWNFDKKGGLANMYVIGPYVGAKWIW